VLVWRLAWRDLRELSGCGRDRPEDDERGQARNADRVRPAGVGDGEQADAGDEAGDGYARGQAGCQRRHDR
jgi:hypothetical protein